MKIGYLKNAYPEQRCIINCAINACIDCSTRRKKSNRPNQYVFCNELLSMTRLKGKVKSILFRKKLGWDALFFKPIIMPRIDIVHTFNHVCEIKKPWIVTFESTVPRTNQTVDRIWEYDSKVKLIPDKITKKSLEMLLKKNCIQLIALSESAKKIQLKMLEHIEFEHIEELKKKITVLHPPQQNMTDEKLIHQKYLTISKKIEFLFVGRDFFRKGGEQLVKVLERYESSKSFHLTIISDLGYQGYATKEEQKQWKDKLEQTSWITWHSSLSNNEVLNLCKMAHVGCLPTLQETYGYSILEMQACGCPVITTNIRACPEINNDSCGWLISLKKDSIGGEAIRYTNQDKEERKSELLSGLDLCIKNIFLHLEQIEKKAVNSMKRIIKCHSPVNYEKKLEKLYKAY